MDTVLLRESAAAGSFAETDRVAQHADALHLDLHHVAWLDRPHARGRAGGDQIARLERDALRDEREQPRHREDLVLRAPVLAELAVDPAADGQVRPVEPRRDPGPHRTKSIEALGARPLAVGLLHVAHGDVVEAGDARHRGGALGLARPAQLLADHDAQLRLVVDLRGDGGAGKIDGLAVPDQRRGRLDEDERRLRGLPAHLFRVVVVVLADREDLAADAPRQKLHLGDGPRPPQHAPALQHVVEAGDLLDLRGGPFEGDGALEDLAVLPAVVRDAFDLSHVVSLYWFLSPSASCMSYRPGDRDASPRAARTAPRAKLSRLVARWVSSSRAPSARKETGWAPTTSPPRRVCRPLVRGLRAPAAHCLP